MSEKPYVGIVMGSDSDISIMSEAAQTLEKFGVEYRIDILSAHRTPQKTAEYAQNAINRGIGVIIAGAGGAAHLAGNLAAWTVLPVLGVPIASSSLQGLDALLATVQMPAGVPVATLAIGKAGAKNAAILAVQILSLHFPELRLKLINFKREMEEEIEKKNAALSK